VTGIITRRSFLRSMLAAPAIVAASSIMPVRAIAALSVPSIPFGLTPLPPLSIHYLRFLEDVELVRAQFIRGWAEGLAVPIFDRNAYGYLPAAFFEETRLEQPVSVGEYLQDEAQGQRDRALLDRHVRSAGIR
jgi:hypothetical protein